MVSLENRITYIEKIKGSSKLKAFHELLSSNNYTSNNEISEVDELFLGILSSLQTDNMELFEEFYKKKSRSNPSKESQSPFVNDDFLIFCLIVGIVKYKYNKNWIRKIVGIRSQNNITTTFENILNENYYSKNNLSEIVLMFFKLVNPSLMTNNLLNEAYKAITTQTTLFESKSDFQILCAIKAYDLIILLKEAPEGSEIQLLKSFNSKFIKRVKILSWLLQMIFLLAFLFCLSELPVYSPKYVELVNQYGYLFTLLGALGITIIGNQIDFIKKKSTEMTMQILGYPKDLIKNLK